jgi:hypothetical protein
LSQIEREIAPALSQIEREIAPALSQIEREIAPALSRRMSDNRSLVANVRQKARTIACPRI